jgi:hypothetical protein
MSQELTVKCKIHFSVAVLNHTVIIMRVSCISSDLLVFIGSVRKMV